MSSECRNQKHFSSQYPHYNFGIIIIIIIYKTSWGDSSVVKIICCSSRGSEFCSENPLLTTSNCLEFYLQVEALFCPMLAMTYTYYILNQIHTKNTSFKITIIYYCASFAIEICGEVFLHCKVKWSCLLFLQLLGFISEMTITICPAVLIIWAV